MCVELACEGSEFEECSAEEGDEAEEEVEVEVGDVFPILVGTRLKWGVILTRLHTSTTLL